MIKIRFAWVLSGFACVWNNFIDYHFSCDKVIFVLIFIFLGFICQCVSYIMGSYFAS